MKYFTEDWACGNVSDEESEAASQAYGERLAVLLPTLPPDVRRIAVEIDLNDNLIRRIVSDPAQNTLFLGLRSGDQQIGYFDLDLHYDHVTVSASQLEALAPLAGDQQSEALYAEVDREADGFVHRILFVTSRRISPPYYTYRELEIRFKQLRLVTTPCESRYAVSGHT